MIAKSSLCPFTEIYVWGSDSDGQLGIASSQGKRFNSPRFSSFNLVVNSISCGLAHTAFIASNGGVYTLGSNEDGRLGIGSNEIQGSYLPCLVESLSKSKAVQVSCGSRHTAALLDSGKAYFWGYGMEGQLGTDDLKSHNTPQLLNLSHLKPSLKSLSIRYVSCGSSHSMISTDDGSVCGFGSSIQGQLGTGQRRTEKLPVLISCLPEKVQKVACGSHHTLFLTQGKRVYACGDNSQGQLGTGNKKSSLLPVKLMLLENVPIQKICARDFSAALSESGEVYFWGDPQKQQLFPEVLHLCAQKIEDLDIGLGFGVCLDSGGNVYSWGSNSCGELGTGDFEEKEGGQAVAGLKGRKIKAVSCGGSFVVILGKSAGDEAVGNFGVEEIERVKESALIKNRPGASVFDNTNPNGIYISKRTKQQYMKSTENFLNLAKDSLVNAQNEKNYLNDVTNCDGKLPRTGKNLTPIRHLTSEEIRSRQSKTLQNKSIKKPSLEEEGLAEMALDSTKGRENENPEAEAVNVRKYIREFKANNEPNANESLTKTHNFSKIETKAVPVIFNDEISCKSPNPSLNEPSLYFNMSSTKFNPQLKASIGVENDLKRYEKYSKYTSSFHEKGSSSAEVKPKFECHFKANSIHLAPKSNIDKEFPLKERREPHKPQLQPEAKPEIKDYTEPSTQREYDRLKSQMQDLLGKISVLEEDQREIELLKVEQNELKENYLKLEEKYSNLEEKFQHECSKNQTLTSELSQERKKTQEQRTGYEEKLSALSEKLSEREQDIKYLKTESLKAQNYFDENLKHLKDEEQHKMVKFEEGIQQLSESLKNLEDENKFLENNLVNKDSLLEKLKLENEESSKKLRKIERDYEQAVKEKETLAEELKSLNSRIAEKDEKINDLIQEGKKSMSELGERDYKNQRERSELMNRVAELEKSLSEKTHENDFIANELKHEQSKNRQMELEFEKLKKLIQEKNNINSIKPPFHNKFDQNESQEIVKGSPIPKPNTMTLNQKPMLNFSQSDLDQQSGRFLRKTSVQEKTFDEGAGKAMENIPFGGFGNKIKREEQKILNLKNATKTISEKSYSLSRDHKLGREEQDEILTEVQNMDPENSINNSVFFNSNISEIKSKLSNLQKNKAFLEKRMKDFERKLKDSKPQANGET